MRAVGDAAVEAGGAGARVHGAIATRLGGDRGSSDRARWHRAGRTRHGDLALHDRVAFVNSSRARRWRPSGPAERAAAASERRRTTRPCWPIWTPWSSPPPGAIRHRSAGRARACAPWPWRWARLDIRSAIPWSPSSSTNWATACRGAKTREGTQHRDRDAQFRYIADIVRRSQRRQQPTISVDTKKKELVGDFKNGGRAWRPKGTPAPVRVHDFVIPATSTTGGKAIPYGVYNLRRDEGWVSVGLDHDTASFAAHAIRRWWGGRPIPRPGRC